MVTALSRARNVSIAAYKKSGTTPYERYDFVHARIKKRLRAGANFVDMGCGDGGFIRYLKERHPGLDACGVDLSRALLQKAGKQPLLKNVRLVRGDVTKVRLGQKFDAGLMSGVLSIFDDVEPVLKNFFRHLKPGGWGYIFGGFCSAPIDVIVRYKNRHQKSGAWESGLNMFSLESMKERLSKDASAVRAFEFKLSRDLKPQDDPIRTFTLNTRERGRIVVNGANIIREFYLIEFRKKGSQR